MTCDAFSFSVCRGTEEVAFWRREQTKLSVNFMAWEIASSAAGLSPATLTEAHVDEARSFVEMKILPQLKLQLQEELDPPSFKRFSIPTPTPTPEKATTKQTETPKLKAEDPAKPR